MLAERRATLSLAVSAGELLNPVKDTLANYLLLLSAPNYEEKEGGSRGGGKPCQSKGAAAEGDGKDGCCSKVTPQGRISQRLLQWRGSEFSGVRHGGG
jgi:hypothetical protein